MKDVLLRIQYNRHSSEYRVQCQVNGKHNEARTYYASSKPDAMNTLREMQAEAVANGERVMALSGVFKAVF